MKRIRALSLFVALFLLVAGCDGPEISTKDKSTGETIDFGVSGGSSGGSSGDGESTESPNDGILGGILEFLFGNSGDKDKDGESEDSGGNNAAGYIVDAPERNLILEIIERIYQDNMNQLSASQQQLLKDAFRNIEVKIPQDPEGYISMAYMTMVTAQADIKAQAVMAAWGAKQYPDSLCLLNNLGFALFVLKDNKDAETVYKWVLGTDSKYIESIVNLGNLYLDTDRDEEAKDCYESAIAVDKDTFKAWEGLYGYYMKKKNFKKAMALVEKISPGGFVQKGAQELQREAEEKKDTEKLEHIDDGDSLDEMDRKLDKIAQSKPLNLAPVVDDISPEMAEKIRKEMETVGVEVSVPSIPWPYKFTSAKDYYISEKGYSGSGTFSAETMKYNLDPETIKMGEQIAAMSEEELKSMVDDYVKNIQDALGSIKSPSDLGDLSKAMEAMKGIQKATQADPFGSMATNGPTQGAGTAGTSAELLGTAEKSGMVTSSNYQNYLAHKINFNKYIQKANKEFQKKTQEIGTAFNEEMQSVGEKQSKEFQQLQEANQDTEPHELPWTKERNMIREKYIEEFGNYLTSFYRGHVMPAIEKMQEVQALYIKNMSNKKLKNREAEEMKITINAFLGAYAHARAPVDDYEIEAKTEQKEDVRKAIEAQIARVKASAPKAGQSLPQLENYEKEQKTMLQKIYEDVKFETTLGLAKVSYENAEITIGLNDPFSNQYMDLGVNIKDLSLSLTEGEGCEAGFKIATKKGALDVEANVGWSGRQPGKKTTLYFDENSNVVDAQITQTPGSQGFSAEVGAGPVSAEGNIKIESTAEGTSRFVSGIKASVNDIQVIESQYKEDMKP